MHNGTILEHLALIKIVIEDKDANEFNKDSLNKSINILVLATNEPINARYWRIYELIGRLVSLKNEDNPEKAGVEII